MYFCFLVKRRSFQLLSDFLRTGRALIFLDFLSFSSQTPLQSPQPAFLKLTFLHPKGIRNLNALAYLPKKYYLCVEMSWKGSISRMSDECLMKGESGMLYFGEYQAVMRKFTLAGKAINDLKGLHITCLFCLQLIIFIKPDIMNGICYTCNRN